jgi:type I restriction enzyme S subunit
LSHEPVISHIINTALGSAQPNISTDGIGITKLVLPDSKVIHVFNSLIDSSFKKIIALRKEINYLSQLRDTLLPRLISGKLRVGEISETVEALAL